MIGSNIEFLEAKLLEAKYINIPENDHPRFVVKDVVNYKLVEGFPRIIPDYLIEGVESVRYKVNLSFVDKFKINEQVFWEDS